MGFFFPVSCSYSFSDLSASKPESHNTSVLAGLSTHTDKYIRISGPPGKDELQSVYETVRDCQSDLVEKGS